MGDDDKKTNKGRKVVYYILVANYGFRLSVFRETLRSNLVELDLKNKDVIAPKKTNNAITYYCGFDDLLTTECIESKVVFSEDFRDNFEYYILDNAYKLVDIVSNERGVSKEENVKLYNSYEDLYTEWENIKSNYEDYKAPSNITLDDVILTTDTKQQIMQFINFFKNKELYDEIGATIPRGLLLTGEPGTGKTLLAEAISTECDLRFKFICASELKDKYVGSSAKNIKQMFDYFKGDLGILYIDELDSIGMARSFNTGEGHEHNDALNQLLSCMTDKNYANVVIIGSTNLPEALDPALVRSGRFDRKLKVEKPDYKCRKELFDLYLNKVKYLKSIDCDYLASITEGLVGADIATIINLAAIDAVYSGRKKVLLKDIEHELKALKEEKYKSKVATAQIGF